MRSLSTANRVAPSSNKVPAHSKVKINFFFKERIWRLVKKQAESRIIPILSHWIRAWVAVLSIRTGIMGGEATLERDDKFCLG